MPVVLPDLRRRRQSGFWQQLEQQREGWNRLPEGRTLPDPQQGMRGRSYTERGLETQQFREDVRQGLEPIASRRNVARQFSPQVEAALAEASRRAGVPIETLRAYVTVESSGDPNARTGSYKGLFQLSDSEFRRHGGSGSIFDANENAMAAARKIRAESIQFERQYGRPPTAFDLYMTHQQGPSGYAAHLSNPQGAAWENIRQYYRSDAIAKQAVWGNIPAEVRQRYGRVENVPSSEFLAQGWWGGRFERAGGDVRNPLSYAPRTDQSPVQRPEAGPAPQPVQRPDLRTRSQTPGQERRGNKLTPTGEPLGRYLLNQAGGGGSGDGFFVRPRPGPMEDRGIISPVAPPPQQTDPSEATRRMLARTDGRSLEGTEQPFNITAEPDLAAAEQPFSITDGRISPVDLSSRSPMQAGKGPGPAGGWPTWAREAFERAGNMPITPVDTSSPPPPPPSTDNWLQMRFGSIFGGGGGLFGGGFFGFGG